MHSVYMCGDGGGERGDISCLHICTCTCTIYSVGEGKERGGNVFVTCLFIKL